MKKVVAIILSVCFLGIGYYFGTHTLLQEKAAQTTENTITSTTFTCDGGKTVQAIFFDGKVELNLSDKRSMLLLQAISASGVRYANSDESFVFWNKGNTAFITEKEKITFKDCIIQEN